jgi:hypothetical protein
LAIDLRQPFSDFGAFQMKSRQPGFSLEKHQALGQELAQMHERIAALAADVGNTYGHRSKVNAAAHKAAKVLADLRSEMDNVVFQENPDYEANFLSHIYYPTER